MALNPDQYRLSEAQHQAIFERDIKPLLFAGAQPSERPVAVIFGGQPGAGKSAAVAAAKEDLGPRGGAVEIIGDDLRGFHPHYARLMADNDKTAAFYTDRDTGRWVEMSIAEAKVQRVNVVIEGTMRDSSKVAETMGSLRAAGYEIDARALAVNARLSEQGILQRYETQKADRDSGRMTTLEAHQAAYQAMPATLERIEREQLADRVTIYRRGAEAIYSNELQGGQWVREPQARAVVEAERARPMTLQERRDYARGFDELASMLAKPSRQAGADETSRVAELQRQANAMVAAEVFRQGSPERAMQQHPELAAAYGGMAAIEAKAKAEGLDEQQRAVVMARVHENVAASIERGDAANLQVRVLESDQAREVPRRELGV